MGDGYSQGPVSTPVGSQHGLRSPARNRACTMAVMRVGLLSGRQLMASLALWK